jgi:hypothetical protein
MVGDRGGEKMKVAHGRSEVIDIEPKVDPRADTCGSKVILDADTGESEDE